MRLDELSNEVLEFVFVSDNPPSRDSISLELDRVADIIRNNSLVGVNLEYWFERERILNELLDYQA